MVFLDLVKVENMGFVSELKLLFEKLIPELSL